MIGTVVSIQIMYFLFYVYVLYSVFFLYRVFQYFKEMVIGCFAIVGSGWGLISIFSTIFSNRANSTFFSLHWWQQWSWQLLQWRSWWLPLQSTTAPFTQLITPTMAIFAIRKIEHGGKLQLIENSGLEYRICDAF